MWEISNNFQILSFLYSIILGAGIALIYDIFRAFRLCFNTKNITVFVQDIIYFIIISNLIFLFLISTTKGEVRGYVLLGICIGFVVSNMSISKVFLICITWVLRFFLGLMKKFLGRFNYISDKIICFIEKIFKKGIKCFKKGLKNARDLLYTSRK